MARAVVARVVRDRGVARRVWFPEVFGTVFRTFRHASTTIILVSDKTRLSDMKESPILGRFAHNIVEESAAERSTCGMRQVRWVRYRRIPIHGQCRGLQALSPHISQRAQRSIFCLYRYTALILRYKNKLPSRWICSAVPYGMLAKADNFRLLRRNLIQAQGRPVASVAFSRTSFRTRHNPERSSV